MAAGANGDSVLIFTAGVLIMALGIAFYWYVAMIAVLPFTLVAVREISARRGGPVVKASHRC